MGAREIGQCLDSNYVKKGAVRVHEGNEYLVSGQVKLKALRCQDGADILELQKMLQ